VTSVLVTMTVFGRPEIWSRPRTSIASSFCSGTALPIVILISSAVRSPIVRLWRRFT